MTVTILTGDCRQVLATLSDESVHCVVTSPPYFGLRDYGTAAWEGGDPTCEHVVVDAVRTPWANEVPGPNGRVKNTVAGHRRPKEVGGRCAHCGAVRADRQIGLESTPAAFVDELVAVFREVRRVLRPDGTLWLNLGDSYAGSWGAQSKRVTPGEISRNTVTNHPKPGRQTGTIREAGLKPKDLFGIPWRVAFALQADGWWLRQDIIWAKPNPMPESVEDRCTKAHEYMFLLSKSERYHFDAAAIAEPATGRAPGNVGHKYSEQYEREGSERLRTKAGLVKVNAKDTRNKRSVWTVASHPFADAHYATFPPALIVDCIKAGCPEGGIVLDPFGGAGTTGLVADRLGRDAILIELNPDNTIMAERRIAAAKAGPVERARIRHGHKPAPDLPLFAVE